MRAMLAAVATVLWLLAIALWVLEGWWWTQLVCGIGLGWYFRGADISVQAELRTRDRVRRWEWRQ